MRHALLLTLAVVLLTAPVTAPAQAQAPPATDLWLLPLAPDAPPAASSLVRMTDRAAYDNQPHVLPADDAVLFTSYRDGQTDIFRYDVADGRLTQLTDTPESEYSPTPMPDGTSFSTVRVEADGTQRLWAFPLAGGPPALLLPDVAPVGYHAWGDDDRLGLFVLGEPPTFQVASVATGTADTLASNIGRSLHRVPGRQAISFVQKYDTTAAILTYALGTGAIAAVAPTLPGSEDYAWLPDGSLVMADGTTLYRWAEEHAWSPWVDLAGEVPGPITRLAVHPEGDYLVLVSGR